MPTLLKMDRKWEHPGVMGGKEKEVLLWWIETSELRKEADLK